MPADAAGWQLFDADGRIVPLQVSRPGEKDFVAFECALRGSRGLPMGSAGVASFVIAQLPAGALTTYRLKPASAPVATPTRVDVKRGNGALSAEIAGKKVFAFQEEKSVPSDPSIREVFRRAGYIHPILSPAGTLVTDDYPRDHRHHHGIWWAWTKTKFEGREPDFWNVGGGKARVDLLAVDDLWSGPVHGGFVARMQMIDLTGPAAKAAVNDTWHVRLYAVGEGMRRYWMFDLISTQACASESPLVLPTYHYGGLGVRGHGLWNGKDAPVKFLTSTGETNRLKTDNSRVEWFHMGGPVDGAVVGMATLGHPQNFRAPEPIRVNPTNPFVCVAPSQGGDWEMVPGKNYTWRYRFIVHDGEPDKAWLDARWRDFATPVEVEVSR